MNLFLKMKLILFVILFFALSSLIIISNNELAFYDRANISKFSELYSGWFENIFGNFNSITGEIIKMNWLPEKSINQNP